MMKGSRAHLQGIEQAISGKQVWDKIGRNKAFDGNFFSIVKQFCTQLFNACYTITMETVKFTARL